METKNGSAGSTQSSGEKNGNPRPPVNRTHRTVALAALAVLASLAVYGFFQHGRFGLFGGKIPVSISSFSPTGEVDDRTNFDFEFTYPMVGESEVDKVMKKVPVAFTPKIPGVFKWVSTHRLRFFTEAPLKRATEYSAEVMPEIVKNPNAYLKGDREFSFHTAPLKVLFSKTDFVYERAATVETRIRWSLEFSLKVRPKKLADRIKIYYDRKNGSKEIPFTITPSSKASDKFEVVTGPIERGGDVKDIKLVVGAGLRSVDGPLGLTDDYVALMKVETELKIYSVFPQQVERKQYIRIELSAPVDPDLASERIELDPKTDFTVEQNDRYLDLKGDFAPGQYYTVRIGKGLIGADGTTLKDDFEQKVFTGDLEPSIAFQYDGIYLPRKGSKRVAVDTVNVKKIQIEIEKVYLNNLVPLLRNYSPYDDWYYGGELGRTVYSKEIEIESERNQIVSTPIDLSEYLDTEYRGIFRVSVHDSDEEWWRSDNLLVMVTDLGIAAKLSEDDLFVWVNSLQTLAPAGGVEVKLFSKNNQLVAEGRTDQNGVLIIRNLKSSLEAEKFEPYLLTATLSGDTTFLKFSDCRLPLASFDVEGRKFLTFGYEAFVYTDRGVYRPGDRARVAAIVRGRDASTPAQFPVRLEVLDPAGRKSAEIVRNIDGGGMAEFNVEFPDYARTGGYIAKLTAAGEEIGRAYFNVEDFIPDKIKVAVSADKALYGTGEDMTITVDGQTLFGPPASGRKAEAKLQIKSVDFSPAAYRDYRFGDYRGGFDQMDIEAGQGVLDENGKITFKAKIPADVHPPAALKGVISATVTETGGRAVSAYADVDIHAYPYYIGLRTKTEGYAQIGKRLDVDIVTVGRDGKPRKAGKLAARVYKVLYNTVLKKDNNGFYRYVSEATEREAGTFGVEAGAKRISYTPTDWGSYRLEVKDPAGRAATSIRFYAEGEGYYPWSMENPERVEVQPEKESYEAGETAKLTIKAPFAGRLLIVVEREKVYDYWMTTMSGNTATVELPVRAAYLPNVYVSATVIKSLDKYDGRSPLRAFGVAPLRVDASGRKLSVKITAPDAIRPKTKLDLKIKVSNSGGTAYVTVAAVDEGILQLTDFDTPDPFEFFYGKKRLSTEEYDVFSYILPEPRGVTGKPAGDYLSKIRKKHLSPIGIRRVEPVALWSGVVATDSAGNARVKLDVPQFQGRLRVMAVAANGQRTGSGRTDVYVRDKIVLTETFPRFVTAGDTFTAPVSVYNGVGKKAKFTVTLKVDGPVDITGGANKTVSIEKGKEKVVYFDLKVRNAIGKVKFTLEAAGGGEKTYGVTNVPVRPSSPVVTRTGSEAVTQKEPYTAKLPGGFIDGTENARIVMSAFPSVRFAKSIQYLLHYPHGCIEQTTSRVFPLLYFDDIARIADPEFFKVNGADYFLQEGIKKISSLQLDDGSFSYWPGESYSNDWSSVYASHFLVEARKAGYSVPDGVYDKMLANLKRLMKEQYNQDNHHGMSDYLQLQVYGAYVLSLAGQPPKSTISYIKENHLKKLTLSSQYQLALCFAKAGDMKTALALLPPEVQPAAVKRETGGNFNSSVRENAVMLNVLAEIAPNSPGIPVLARELSKSAEANEWYTTQDNAFAFLALGKVFSKQKDAEFTGELKAGGKTVAKFDEKGLTVEDAKLVGKKITVEIEGRGNCYVYWQAWGVPVKPEYPEYDKGIRVTREYLGLDGRPLDYKTIKQGQLVVGKITMTALTADLQNVAIDDMLPAGLEIENPRLATSAQIPWIQKSDFAASYMDIRDDRLLLYVNLQANKPAVFYYGLRAVTRGDFLLPPVSAEAMYDPTYTSIQSSGMIKVVE